MMHDDVGDIATFYSREPDKEDSRLERHQLEYELTWRYLKQYLPAQGSVLEIGAATGRYTLELARLGYQVTAVDLTPTLLERCRQRLSDAGFEGQAQFVAADARDLRAVTKTDFDVVLLMGPLYHLVVEADRQAALRQAREHLKSGGVIFSAFISRFGIFGDLMRNLPHWIDDHVEVSALLEMGKRQDDYPRGGFRGYFARVPEITPLHEALGFETLVLAGVEPAISADDDSYNVLEGERRQHWLDVLFELSTETSMLGASRHLLYVGRKC